MTDAERLHLTAALNRLDDRLAAVRSNVLGLYIMTSCVLGSVLLHLILAHTQWLS